MIVGTLYTILSFQLFYFRIFSEIGRLEEERGGGGGERRLKYQSDYTNSLKNIMF